MDILFCFHYLSYQGIQKSQSLPAFFNLFNFMCHVKLLIIGLQISQTNFSLYHDVV